MSSNAVAWAWKQDVRPATRKILLLGLAEFANPYTGLCFPSVQALVVMTGLNRKTVIDYIDQLEREGVLEDTGDRVGRTKQIKVYMLNGPEHGTLSDREGSRPPRKGSHPRPKDSRPRDTELQEEPKEGRESLSVVPPQLRLSELDPSNIVEQARRDGWQVQAVFDHWKTVHEHPKAVLDSKRRKLIQAALKSFTVDSLKTAISGYKNSNYHMGDNEHRKVYDDIELMLRDAKHIEAGLRYASAPPTFSQKPRELPILNGGFRRG